jgi:hypothetical protein
MPLPLPTGSAADGALVAALVLLSTVFATALWVYMDAEAAAGRGHPIVRSVGSFQLRTPTARFVACLLLCELFFPLCVDSRSRA